MTVTSRMAESVRRSRRLLGVDLGDQGPRHGSATLLTAAGVAPRVIMEILGHSRISITMDVYTHVVHDTQREAISHTGRLLKRHLPAT